MSGARLAGCSALVTGGLGGIGSAIVARFAAEGAKVWVADLPPASDPRAAALATATGDLAYLQLDVTDEASWARAALAIGPSLTVLVNNAGIAPTASIGSMTLDTWRRTLGVNLDGAFLGTRAMLPLLCNTGGARWSSVINISSILGNVGIDQASAYCASKGAIRQLTKACAIEFGREDKPVRVNSIHPGFVATTMTAQGSEAMSAAGSGGEGDLLTSLIAQTPMKRMARTDEIAAAALFLASEESSFMTGSELVVDGGWTAQ